jgi:hypothetical protein
MPKQIQPQQQPRQQQQQQQQPLQPLQPLQLPRDGPTHPSQSTNDDDFDVAALGQVRDAATPGAQEQPQQKKQLQGLPPPALDASGPIRARMNEFANSMQAGNYPVALQQVVSTLQVLSAVKPRPEREIVACAAYLQALKILLRVRALETELMSPGVHANSPDALRRIVESAMLTMFLAEQRNLLPRHAVAAKKIAVEKNMAAGNMGMAARWLRNLVEVAPPPQKATFSQRLQLCVQNGELNTHMPQSKWLCYSKLVVLSPQNALKCRLCPAVFGSGVSNGQQCPVCLVDTVAPL